MATVTMIKKEAVFNVPVTAGLTARLQQVLLSIVSQRSKEELDTFTELMNTAKGVAEMPEDWMEHVLTLTHLIQVIETEAVKQGHTYEKEINTEDN